MFTVAFWNPETKTLWPVPDPMGVKPLYFAQPGDSLVFASEIKALLRAGWVAPQLDPRAVLRHLGYLWSPGSTSIVKGVHKLRPGHAIEFRGHKMVREWRYRDLAFHPDAALAEP